MRAFGPRVLRPAEALSWPNRRVTWRGAPAVTRDGHCPRRGVKSVRIVAIWTAIIVHWTAINAH